MPSESQSRTSIPAELFIDLQGWSNEDVRAFYIDGMGGKIAPIVSLN